MRTGIIIWKSKGGWKWWHYDVQIKRADGYGTGIMMWK